MANLTSFMRLEFLLTIEKSSSNTSRKCYNHHDKITGLQMDLSPKNPENLDLVVTLTNEKP